MMEAYIINGNNCRSPRGERGLKCEREQPVIRTHVVALREGRGLKYY